MFSNSAVVPKDMENLRDTVDLQDMAHRNGDTPSNNMARHSRSTLRNNTIHMFRRHRMGNNKMATSKIHYLSSPITSQANPNPAVFLVSTETKAGHQRFSDENMSPFVRVRIPEMERHYGITHHEWLIFLDEFNEAWMANPALQAANKAGNVAGMAPSMIAQIVDAGVNVAAGIGSSVTTKARTKKYLENANKDLFNPKGLKCSSLQDGEDARYKQAFEYTQMNAPMVQGRNNPTMQRMRSLGNRVMTISFDNVEAPTKPEGWMKKWGAHEAQKAEEKQNQKDSRQERRAGR
ncbi:hypothetical protein NUU61_005815 [Penicillium alfredii]|uniref:Uncharacterized protein n=1 Tax=Penicillium alfredii TaxID=1506179 RepID=A0A9W9FA88_9EURO|nr:uncharacterized protein NUU61_005815 [Penicillium alfredii]KAJ5096459.1 hypothetical protein NUU61_005815 [Penicillium alfredii]